jgi:enoyl-CoA hydratase/carnithine racemase
MYEEIQYEVAEPAAIITLHRPKQLNAWTTRMAAEVKHAIALAESTESVVAIILTGAGRGFCAGADLKVLQGLSRGQGGDTAAEKLDADPGDPEMGDSFRGTYTYLMSVRKPVIAAINGPVAGMAIPIIACCDLRFASDRASFLTAFPQRGLVAEWGSSWLLPRLIGHANALDLLFSGRKIEADEACRMGLVNRVVPHDDLIEATRTYIDELAANCSPTSVAIIKRQVYRALMQPLDTAEQEAFRLMLESFQGPDFREGVQAFLEKRPPTFARIGNRRADEH